MAPHPRGTYHSRMPEERRLVTVLFADVVGLEELDEIEHLARLHARLAAG